MTSTIRNKTVFSTYQLKLYNLELKPQYAKAMMNNPDHIQYRANGGKATKLTSLVAVDVTKA